MIAEGQQIRRRRECPQCNERFTTFETAELLMPRVIKQKDNSREPFDEHKLREGLYRSLEKRPVGEEEIETLIEDIKKDIRSSGEREIPSRLIGEVVMQNLRKIDLLKKSKAIPTVISKNDNWFCKKKDWCLFIKWTTFSSAINSPLILIRSLKSFKWGDV